MLFKNSFLLLLIALSFFSSACAAIANPAPQTLPATSLQEWRRSYLPTRLG